MTDQNFRGPGPLTPSDFKKRILYEDQDILALDKPAGLAAHGDQHHVSGETLISSLRHYVASATDEPAFIQRLDKETTGVMIAAKNPEALRHLNRQLKFKKITKKYWALLLGEIQPGGSIRLALAKKLDRKRWLALMTPVKQGGQHAVTDFRRLKLWAHSTGKFSLAEAEPKTGRTHQLRAHFAALGCPIVGDDLYGNIEINKMLRSELGLQRMLLHAVSIEFAHPTTHKTLWIECPLAPDFAQFIERLSDAGWKDRRSHR